MIQSKNIHVLPTDKPSRLLKNNEGKLILAIQTLPIDEEIGCFPQNIYITNDEEPKAGDYAIATLSGNSEVVQLNQSTCIYYNFKIILTTDQDLIKDGVQAIDDEFLEWFVKNPSCEEVEVDKDKRLEFEQDFHFYELIIPKEEPKQDAFNYSLNAFKVPKEYFGKEEPKQETLEEVAERLNLLGRELYALKLGAKWQQQRSYSEEEVYDIVQKAYSIGRYSPLIGVFDKWFKQFKKK